MTASRPARPSPILAHFRTSRRRRLIAITTRTAVLKRFTGRRWRNRRSGPCNVTGGSAKSTWCRINSVATCRVGYTPICAIVCRVCFSLSRKPPDRHRNDNCITGAVHTDEEKQILLLVYQHLSVAFTLEELVFQLLYLTNKIEIQVWHVANSFYILFDDIQASVSVKFNTL